MKHNYLYSKPGFLLVEKLPFFGFLLAAFFLLSGTLATAQTAGPNLPGLGATQAGAGNAWVNPTRIQANDNTSATVLMNPGEFSRAIRGTNYGFAIPAASTITGIGVTIKRRSDTNGGGNSINDLTLQLVKAGTPIGSNLAVATDWPITLTNATYGGPGVLWGTTWTVADINAANFGVNFAVQTQAVSSDRTASVDFIQVTVYYSPSTPTITSFTPANVCSNANAAVIISGTNFTGATSVKINGVNVTYTVNSATQITATYPAGGTGGAIAVQTPSGTATSATNLIVNTMPTVAAITGSTSVCRFATTTLSNATGGGTWSSATPAVATINSASGLVTGVTAGTSVITYTVTSGACTNTATMTMTVTALPVLSGPSSVCIGNTIQLSPATGGTWTSSNGNASIDNTGLVTGLLQGNATFTFTNTATGCSSTTGNVAINSAPSIGSQSGSQLVCSGSPVSFSVSATGTGLTYQWYNGATMLNNAGNISGATSNSLTINPVALADASADYHCIVSGTCAPAATSTSVALNVTEKVVITGQPIASQSLCSGNTATFSVNATGTGLTYQWYNGATPLVDAINVSGATSATLTLNNLVVGDASTTYHCTITGTTPCNPVTSNNATLIVNQGPGIVAEPVATQTVCSGASVSISVTASGGSLTYLWYRNGSPIANGGTISGATSPTLIINPTTPSDSFADYHCVVTNGCVLPATSANSELVVNEKPFIFSYTTSTCSETAFLVDPVSGTPTVATIVPSGTTYSWGNPVVTGGLTGGSAQSGQAVISQVLFNPTNTNQTATYTVTPVSGTSGACAGANFTVVVTVNPKPFIVNSSSSICSGENLIVTPANGGGNIVPAGTTYSWSAPTVTGGITGGTSGTGTSVNITLTNPTNTVQTASYNVTAMSGSCMGSVFSIAVDVNPKPTVAANLATQTICSGAAIAPITMSNPNNVAGTIDYNWTRNNNGTLIGMPAAGNGSVITGNLTNTTNTQQIATFTLTATSDQSCNSTPITVTVVVDPIPTVAATPTTQTICSGNAISTINFSNPNNIAGTVVYTWTRTNDTLLTGIPSSGSGTNIPGNLTNTTLTQQTTVFTISATVNGCGTNTTTATVIVNPKPDVAATPATQTLCGGLAIAPISITNPNGISGTTISWTRNNTANLTGITASGTSATINGTLVNNTNVDQTTTFTISAVAAACPSTPVTVDVVVKPTPLTVATPAAQSVCNGSVANIAFSTTNNLAGTTFSWTRDNVANIGGIAASGSGNISATVTNTTSTSQLTTFTIVAAAPNGCQKTITATLTVYPNMTTPGIEDSQVVCSGSRPTTFFITTPVSGGSGAFTYQWQISTTSATGPWTTITGATNPTYQPPTTNGSTLNSWYQVLVSSCGSTVTSNSVSVVVANNSNFSFSIDNGSGTFCPGSNFNPRIYSFHGSGARIRYSWIADPAYISPASGGPIGNTAGCIFGICLSEATLPLVLSNNTNANVTTTISITPNIYDADTGLFVCSLTPQTVSVTIRPKPTATAIAPNPLFCSGTSAGVVVTSNVTPASAVVYNWTRSANANVTSSQGTGNSGTVAIGSSYTIPDILTNTSTSNQSVTYTITPTSGAGCAGTPTTITVTVAPQLLPGVVAANQTLCNSNGDPVGFTQTTAATGGGTLTYQWQSSTTSASGPWTDIPGATAITYDSGIIAQTTWFIRVVTSTVSGITCSVGNTTPIQVSLNNISPGAISGTQSICSGGDPTVFVSNTAGTGSGTVAYQWQSNTTGCGGTYANIGGATAATYDVPAGLVVTTYYRRATISTLNAVACTDYSNCITVFVNNVTGGTIGSDETLCGNNPSLISELTASTGSGTLSYQWQFNTTSCGAAPGAWTNIGSATSATYDPPAGVTVTTYYRRVTTSTFNGVSCIAYSNCTTVTPNGVTPGSIGPNSTSVCAGGDPAAFTELTAGSGTGLTYQWQISTAGGSGPWSDISGATGATYDAPGPINVITYFRRLAIATVNSTTCSSASNFLTVFVNNVTPSTVAGDQSFCGSGNPAAFTVTTAATYNGTPSYQWQSSIVDCSTGWNNIAGALSATYDAPVISQTTYYRVIVTSTLNGVPCSAISNCITVTSYGKTWNGSVNTDWNNGANWTPNGVPTAINCVTIPNTTLKPFVLGTNFDAYCYSLTILNGGKLEVNATNSITVSDVVTVNTGGTFNIRNNSALIQINNVANVGNINMERITQPMYRYDYTYWGSPLTLGSNFTLGGISPNTQPDKYYSWNPTNAGGNGNWIQNSAATVINPNRGYIIRAPQTYSMDPFTTQAYTANFIGVPNNGNVSVPIVIGTQPAGLFNDKLNLIGNPYPSAVNADLFLNDATNSGLIDGTIYFWTHHSPPNAANPNPFYGNYTYNYTAGDYATYTLFGVTATVPSGYIGASFTKYIAAGQGFFVKGTNNGTARFTNSMRVRNENNAFFRHAELNSDQHHLWINLANAQGGFSQALVGYAEGATLGYDRGFEGSSFSGNFVSFYSILDDQQTVTIQARPLPFDDSDKIVMGYHATAPNNYTIGIDHLDGLFGNQNVYLEDKLLNIIYDIKAAPYNFTSEAGTFNERFVIRYTNTTLGIHNPETAIGLAAIITNQKIFVEASQNIKTIQVFDITGKHIVTYDPAAVNKKFQSDFNYADGIYIAKIKLEDGSIVTHKLVKNE